MSQTTEAEQTFRDEGAPITVTPPEAAAEVTSLEELGRFLS